jgi:hypothetical protein
VIGGVLEVIRARVLAPQATVPVLAERVYQDKQRGKLNVQRNTAELVGLTSTPMNPQIGSGFGGVAGGTMTVRHIAALVVTCQGANRSVPEAIRDKVTTSLVARALGVDWVNQVIGGGQTIDKVAVTIEYADIESESLAAYATVVFTVDTEWTV